MNSQTKTESNKVNIYKDYIIPTIKESKGGDELLFISPSTFFGFYSLGAKNFEEVCSALMEAVDKKVTVHLIVNIHDPFSARATRGLLKFLKDSDEIRNWQDNKSVYRISCISKNLGEAIHYSFRSDQLKKLDCLEYIEAIPFASLMPGSGKFTKREDVAQIRNEFDAFWNKSSKIGNEVYKYDIDYRRLVSIRMWKAISYVIALFVGMIIGMIICYFLSVTRPHEMTLLKTLGYVALSLLLGVISSLFANHLVKIKHI